MFTCFFRLPDDPFGVDPVYLREYHMLELSILGFLYDQNLNGYELNKKIARLAGYYTKLSDGSLYPAIKRLQQKDLLLKKEDPGSSGRKTHILQITEKGKVYFLDQLRNPPEIQITDRNRYFTVLAFMHHLDSTSQLHILERRFAFISQKKGFFFKGEKPMKGQDVKSPFKKGMYEIAKATDRAENKWLKQIINSLKKNLETVALNDIPQPKPDEK